MYSINQLQNLCQVLPFEENIAKTCLCHRLGGGNKTETFIEMSIYDII